MMFSLKCVARYEQSREWVADEIERISKMVRNGITAGDVDMVNESGDTCFHSDWQIKPEDVA